MLGLLSLLGALGCYGLELDIVDIDYFTLRGYIMENEFKKWMKDNYSDNELADIANHGCSGGVGGMIYYRETEAIYTKYACELHEILKEYKENVGNFPDYVTDELGYFSRFTNAVVWFCAEIVAQEITQGEYISETELRG